MVSTRGIIARIEQSLPNFIRDHVHDSSVKSWSEQRLFRKLRSRGYYPDTIIDVGAYEGEWTKAAHKTFSKSSFILIEAQEEKKTRLERIDIQDLSIYTEVVSEVEGSEVEFYHHETGSSYYRENVEAGMESEPKTTTTLDKLLSSEKLGETFLKLDIQGAEIDALRGATELLNSVSAVYIECSNVEWNEGAPMVEDVIREMRTLGYTPYDTGAPHLWNSHLTQIDILFLDSSLELARGWKDELDTVVHD